MGYVVHVEDVGYVSEDQMKVLGYPDLVMDIAERRDLVACVLRLIVMAVSGGFIQYEREWL